MYLWNAAWFFSGLDGIENFFSWLYLGTNYALVVLGNQKITFSCESKKSLSYKIEGKITNDHHHCLERAALSALLVDVYIILYGENEER